MNETDQPTPTDRVECLASLDPAVNKLIIAGMLLLFGAWCFWDAFIAGKYPYPEDGDVNKIATYYFNRVGGTAFPVGGLIALALALKHLRQKLVATADGVGYEGKPPVAWETVTRLDAADLAGKGILRLHHGPDEPFVLDSWKLKNFKALVAFVEQHVPPNAIEAAITAEVAEETDGQDE